MRESVYIALRVAGVAVMCASSWTGTTQGQAQRTAGEPNATVKADALTVYSDMRVSSAAVSSLKKGEQVIVDFEFKTAAERWCRVKLPSQGPLGYVQCAGLDRKAESVVAGQPAASRTVGSGTTGAARHAVSGVALGPPPTKTTSGYEEVANLVVREGSIDVVKVAELDAAARTGSPAASRRAWLAHCAAGDFEMSRNSVDEAIEHYRNALPFASKQSDLLVENLVRLGYVHLRRSEYSAALEYLDRARGAAPKSVVVARLSGWAYYGLDRLDEAVEQWKRAEQMEPDADVATLLRKAEADKETESGFRQGQTSHFTLHYEGTATPQLAAQILQALEEDFRSEQAELRFAPQEPIAVVLYTQQTFRDITQAPSWAGAGNDGRIRVPVQGLTSVSDELARVLKHELTHTFIRGKTQNRCPQWLHEGLAQWMEGRRSDRYASLLIAAFEQHAYPQLRYLEHSWDSFSGPQAGFAYAWSLATVEYIIATGGMWGIERLLDTLASGSPVEPALGSALQTTYADLERATAEYLRRTYASN
jgi:tetratricopeptide (TPR) repeat protein